MGVSTNFLTIYGIKIKSDDAFNDIYDEVYDDFDTPNVLQDYMMGEYTIFGIELFDSGDMRYGFENGDQFKEIDIVTLPQLGLEYKEQFVKKFPEFRHYMEKPFKLMTLAHYS